MQNVIKQVIEIYWRHLDRSVSDEDRLGWSKNGLRIDWNWTFVRLWTLGSLVNGCEASGVVGHSVNNSSHS